MDFFDLLVNDDDRPVPVLAAPLMHVDNEIEYGRRMAEFRPIGTVQHAHVQLVVVLNGLYGKVAANVVALVHLR